MSEPTEPTPTTPDEERFIDDPTTLDPTEEDIRDAAEETGDLPPIDEELADRDAARQLRTVEPGAEGPPGSGVEGADDVLVESTDDAGEIRDASGSASDLANDLQPAAEQGHRVGDEMVGHGDDPSEVEDLSGDEQNVDALADDGAERVDDVDGLPRVDGEPDDR